MKTFNRIPKNIDVSATSYSKIVKYYNQLQWKGLMENKNIFDVDQDSQNDAKNVYVDGHGSLVSREPLQEETVSEEILPENYKLVEIKEYGRIKVYVAQNTEDLTYRISAVKDDNIITLDLHPTKYNIVNIDNYIVCFNDISAKVLDINNLSRDWFLLEQIAEIPVVSEDNNIVDTYNKFTNKYKRNFSFNKDLNPDLPMSDFTISSGVNMSVRSKNKTNDWHFSFYQNKVVDYDFFKHMSFKQLNFTFKENAKYDISSNSEQNLLAIYEHDSSNSGVYISFNNGDVFTFVKFGLEITDVKLMSITDDGYHCMVVSSGAVYALDLRTLYDSDRTIWLEIHPWDDANVPLSTDENFDILQGYYHFATLNIFTFITKENHGRVWFKGPGLVGYKSSTMEPEELYAINNNYVGTLGYFDLPDYVLGNYSYVENYRLLKNIHDSGIRIFVNKGKVVTGATPPTFNSYGDLQNKGRGGTLIDTIENGHSTIIINLLEHPATQYYTPYVNKLYTLVLPTTQCVKFNNDTVAPLQLENISYETNNYTLFTCLGSTHDQDIINFPRDNTNLFANSKNYTKISEGGEGDIRSTFFEDHHPLAVRIDNISHNINFSIGLNKTDVREATGVWKFNGSMLLNIEDQSSYNLFDFNKVRWYSFVYEVSYSTVSLNPRVEGRILLTEKLDINIPTLASDRFYTDSLNTIVPYKLTENLYFDLRSIFNTSKTDEVLGSNIDISTYNNLLKMPDQIWQNLTIISNYSQKYDYPYEVGLDIELVSLDKGTIYFMWNNKLYSNKLNTDDLGVLTYYYNDDAEYNYSEVPNLSFENNNDLYLCFDNLLSITANSKDEDGNTLLYLPAINDQKFIDNITNIINISTTEIALFFENKIIICKKVEDENIGFRYDYLPTKLSTGTRLGDSVINTIEGTYTIFPTKRGLAFMNYQAFMATSDQVLTYMSDNIEDRYNKFYNNSTSIKLLHHRERLYVTNGTGDILIYDFNRGQWWYWEVPVNIQQLSSDQVDLRVVSSKLYIFKEHKIYKDFPFTDNAKMIDWYISSQPLHFKAPNYYKNLKQLIFYLLEDEHAKETTDKISINVQIQCYRKKLDVKEPETINFTIEELRTFVKRFNYWKINEVQYAIGSDLNNITPTRLRLNGVTIKYELGEEVR